MSPEVLHNAITVAKDTYRVERWWKYGQPAIDRITATVDVTDIASAGPIIGSLIRLQGQQRQIGIAVFPYGILNHGGSRWLIRQHPLASKQ
jgi:hypothetical protein